MTEDSNVMVAPQVPSTCPIPFIDRLISTASAFENSLLGEFYPSKTTVLDWQHSVSMLLSVTQCLRHAYDPPNDPELQHAAEGFCAAVQQKLHEAWIALSRSGVPPAKSLNLAQRNLDQMTGGLKRWRDDERISWRSPQADDMLENRFEEALAYYFEELEQIANNDFDGSNGSAFEQNFPRCMSSRKLYLVAFCAGSVSPDLWKADEFAKFVALHDQLLSFMIEPSHYRHSIERRLGLAKKSPLLNPARRKAAG